MDSVLMTIILLVSTVIVLLIAQLVFRNRLFQRVQSLQEWKQDIKGRPVADQLKKVKALNVTGQAEELFESWRESWDEVAAVTIPKVEIALKSADGHIAQFKFGRAKEEIGIATGILEETDGKIQEILSELQELVETHEKNSMEIEEIRTTYRDIKKTVLAHRHSFSLAEEKLEETMDAFHERFQAYEEAVGNGNYLDAQKIVNDLEERMKYLQLLIVEIPELQVECQTNIPVQLEDLLAGHEEMKKQGYVLDHLEIPKEAAVMDAIIRSCLLHIKELEITKAKQQVAELKEKMDMLYGQLETEVTSKHQVSKEVADLNEVIDTVREEVLQTKEETQFVKQSYELSDKDVEIQKFIEKQISVLIKRFEMIQIRIAEQDIAFSVIREELEDIRQQITAIAESHKNYKGMLQTLRKEELTARDSLGEMRKQMVEMRRSLQKSNLPGLPEECIQKLYEAQTAIHTVYVQLEMKPLNMATVNKVLEEATLLIDLTYKETIELVELGYLVEKAIQYGNRYRSQNMQMAKELEKAEELFRGYDYTGAFEQIAATLEKAEPGVIQKIKELAMT
ncbi:septation ring formation regulator EzrA [Bacillus sp. 165]|uniref:septation ring formation regulator EzrA n=1 Tax=Bacillus sp. 165 TaxID=1529117 RepID=UPI001ADBD19A|nr:septation ring formation regulator EzrA [Bacillus sp. 165]MBO9131204.1 septation ring formation regulator EzrA [Bacillus sp. 165]